MNAAEALERARQNFRTARRETDLPTRFRAYLSAGYNVLDAAIIEPESPRVKKAMQALLAGIPTEEE